MNSVRFRYGCQVRRFPDRIRLQIIDGPYYEWELVSQFCDLYVSALNEAIHGDWTVGCVEMTFDFLSGMERIYYEQIEPRTAETSGAGKTA